MSDEIFNAYTASLIQPQPNAYQQKRPFLGENEGITGWVSPNANSVSPTRQSFEPYNYNSSTSNSSGAPSHPPKYIVRVIQNGEDVSVLTITGKPMQYVLLQDGLFHIRLESNVPVPLIAKLEIDGIIARSNFRILPNGTHCIRETRSSMGERSTPLTFVPIELHKARLKPGDDLDQYCGMFRIFFFPVKDISSGRWRLESRDPIAVVMLRYGYVYQFASLFPELDIKPPKRHNPRVLREKEWDSSYEVKGSVSPSKRVLSPSTNKRGSTVSLGKASTSGKKQRRQHHRRAYTPGACAPSHFAAMDDGLRVMTTKPIRVDMPSTASQGSHPFIAAPGSQPQLSYPPTQPQELQKEFQPQHSSVYDRDQQPLSHNEYKRASNVNTTGISTAKENGTAATVLQEADVNKRRGTVDIAVGDDVNINSDNKAFNEISQERLSMRQGSIGTQSTSIGRRRMSSVPMNYNPLAETMNKNSKAVVVSLDPNTAPSGIAAAMMRNVGSRRESQQQQQQQQPARLGSTIPPNTVFEVTTTPSMAAVNSRRSSSRSLSRQSILVAAAQQQQHLPRSSSTSTGRGISATYTLANDREMRIEQLEAQIEAIKGELLLAKEESAEWQRRYEDLSIEYEKQSFAMAHPESKSLPRASISQ